LSGSQHKAPGFAGGYLLVATLNNTIYAFDADSSSPIPLWSRHFDPPHFGTIVNNNPTGHNVSPSSQQAPNGIMSTPAIDKDRVAAEHRGVIYFVEMFDFSSGGANSPNFMIYAISLYDGATVAGPYDIGADSQLQAAGFDTKVVLNRAGLLLLSGYVYVAFGSRYEGDINHPYHGWVLRFDATSLFPPSSGNYYQTTAGTHGGGGIWQAGTGLAADALGNIYFATGNGDYFANNTWDFYCQPNDGTSYHYDQHLNNCSLPILSQNGAPPTKPNEDEDSIVKLSASLTKIGSYAPWGSGGIGSDFQLLEACDGDFGSSGPILLTQQGLSRLVVGGKTGQLFVLDPTQMSGRRGTDGQLPMTQPAFQAAQNSFIGDPACYDKIMWWGPHIHGSPVFFHGANADYLFIWGEKDYPKRFTVSNGTVVTSPVLHNNTVYNSSYTDSLPPNGMPGGALSISSNGTDISSAILWALVPSKGACGINTECNVDFNGSGPNRIVTGDLLAFSVSNLQMIWGTRNFHAAASPDQSIGAGVSRPIRNYSKFVSPTIANGKVFVATSGFNVRVYGNRTLNTSNATTSYFWPTCTGNLYTGDVDGDGVADLICHIPIGPIAGTVLVAFGSSNPTTFPRATWSKQINWCYPSPRTPNPKLYVGDFDGDGRADLLCHDFATGSDFIAYSQGNPTAPYDTDPAHGAVWPRTNIAGYGWCNTSSDEELVIGDYDGDGHSDLLCHNPYSATQPLRIKTAQLTGDQFVAAVAWESSTAWCYDFGPAGTSAIPWRDQLLAADIDGDGLDDLICHRPSDGYKWVSYNKLDRKLPTPTPAFTGTDWSYPLNWCDDFDSEGHQLDQFGVADLDGDGAADLWCHNRNNGISYVMYAHPRTRGIPGSCGASDPYNCTTDWTRTASDHWCVGASSPTLTVADLDGDNRPDFVCHGSSPTQKSIGYYPISGMTR
jgi:hypothetical protein